MRAPSGRSAATAAPSEDGQSRRGDRQGGKRSERSAGNAAGEPGERQGEEHEPSGQRTAQAGEQRERDDRQQVLGRDEEMQQPVVVGPEARVHEVGEHADRPQVSACQRNEPRQRDERPGPAQGGAPGGPAVDEPDADARSRAAGPSRSRSRGCRGRRWRPPAAPCRARGRGRSRRSRRGPRRSTSFGRASNRTAAPRPIAESAMPTSMPGSFTPSRPSVPPKAMTIGKVTGSSQTAGGPSCAPQSPTAIIASTWSRPETGCESPARNPVASPPARMRGEKSRRAEPREERERRGATPAHRIHPNRIAVRWIVQNAPSVPTAYPGSASTQRGQRIWSVRNARSRPSTMRMNPTWPISTPTLNAEQRERQVLAGQARARQRARRSRSRG